MEPPNVRDIVRECGVGPAELLAVAPDLSPDTLKSISSGRRSGARQAKSIADGLRLLAARHAATAETYRAAADALDPPAETPLPEPEKSEHGTDANAS